MANTKLPNLYSELYGSLDPNTNEIRLVAFEQPQPDSPLLHLTLSTHALDDITEEYATAVTLGNDAHDSIQLRRRTVSGWARRFRNEPGARPPDGAARFRWGDYAALSYVWGSETDRRPIVLNGAETTVTVNLEVALRAMHRTGHYTGNFRLWIDAICINQADEEEQAAQVARMRDIYSGAWGVVAWLGEAGGYSDDALDLLETFAGMAEESQQRPFGQLRLPSSFFFGNRFSGLNALMERPYWSRLWVVQEVVLGASATVLRCGDRRMDWVTFCSAIDVLFRADMWLIKDELLRSEQERRSEPDAKPAWSTLWLHLVHKDLRILSRYHEEYDGRWLGLRRLLDIACSSECRDRRDKVFALLGMMDPQIAKSLSHDYSMSSAILFASVSRAFITRSNNLEALREGNPWGHSGAPSWAADWTWKGRLRYSRPGMPLWGFWQVSHEPEPSLAEEVYRAAGDRAAEFNFVGPRILRCKGFVFDRVAGLGAPGRGYWMWDDGKLIQYPSWRSGYGGYKETAAALCRTLLLDRLSGSRRAEPRHAAVLSLPKNFEVARPQFERLGWVWMSSQEGYYFRYNLWREANDNLQMGEDTRLGDYFFNTIRDDFEEQDYAEVYGAFDRTCKERRYMLTEKGYMGWAPDNIIGNDDHQTRKGDLLCIIFGCSVPLVIRPWIGGYEVVGEAYVDGFMDGEALKLLESGLCQVQDFALS
ncbi:uncharacterized protein E0L32_010272 [Thyridium curvatum]|uniref:Heterokaryon incompatibility domain-containing protein n=1 Tax=Thyridium curvatum TaxID=1093900 RepID=A0A507AGS1_9PEZI|nr:uncharacterized protein E0L32_010272 [Thyridium curvatum]TPX08072.1 hypothetical protein E0L32_010272 [Thyridium curvatum]